MKKITSIILSFFTIGTFAQNEMITTKGIVNFEASIPLYEENKGVNESVYCVLNIKTGEFKSLVIIKGFRFKIALMEEHFNENYIESDRYPKATFNGIIEGFNWYIIGTSPKEFKMNGKLELHGKSKDISTIIYLKKVNNSLEIIADFDLNSDDFNIKIPSVLTKKISKTVHVKANFLVK